MFECVCVRAGRPCCGKSHPNKAAPGNRVGLDSGERASEVRVGSGRCRINAFNCCSLSLGHSALQLAQFPATIWLKRGCTLSEKGDESAV